MKTVACVLFNHPYAKNIPIIQEAMKSRFDEVYFVVPNMQLDAANVIVSYRGSYSFQGLIVDACETLLRSQGDYFFFIQDDVVLNPKFTGADLIKRLKIDEGGAFLPGTRTLGGPYNWHYALLSHIWKLFYPTNIFSGSGVENWLSLLPPADVAFRELESKYGFAFTPIDRADPISPKYASVLDPVANQALNIAILNGLFSTAHEQSKITLPFPFLFAMSDFFAVDRNTLKNAKHMLGVFSAMQLFPEFAIPTALHLTACKVMHSGDTGLHAIWLVANDRESLTFDPIVREFENNKLLLHPVKISQNIELYNRLHSHFLN